MKRDFSLRWRASVVARARFVEDLVIDHRDREVMQYVLLGAGLDTFAVRRPELDLRIFEVDEPGTQEWKRRRLSELGLPVPRGLQFVPFDFESGVPLLDALRACGLDRSRPAVVGSTGVSQYVGTNLLLATMQDAACLASGTAFVCSFILGAELIESQERELREASEQVAAERDHPWISSYTPEEIVALASSAGFSEVRHVSSAELARRYFADRSDGLRPSSSEDLIVATVS
jgi:methyltransferase (TIGR00027 family)